MPIKRRWLNEDSSRSAYVISSWAMEEINGKQCLDALLEIGDCRDRVMLDFRASSAEELNEKAEKLRVLAEVTNEIATALRCYQVRLMTKGEKQDGLEAKEEA